MFTGQIAINGSDYVSASDKLLTLNATMRETDVAVELIDDSEQEGDEDFWGVLTLIRGERVTVGSNSSLATILANDGKIQEI